MESGGNLILLHLFFLLDKISIQFEFPNVGYVNQALLSGLFYFSIFHQAKTNCNGGDYKVLYDGPACLQKK